MANGAHGQPAVEPRPHAQDLYTMPQKKLSRGLVVVLDFLKHAKTKKRIQSN